jgi:hypothetical protein
MQKLRSPIFKKKISSDKKLNSLLLKAIHHSVKIDYVNGTCLVIEQT